MIWTMMAYAVLCNENQSGSREEFMSMVTISAETRVMDPAALEAVAHLFEVVEFSENRIIEENQKTQVVVQQAFGQMQGHLSTLSEENQKLRVELTAEQTRQRETEHLHLAELKALREQLAAAQSEVATVRQDMSKTMHKADERVAAALKSKDEAVRIALLAADARAAALQQTIHTKDAQIGVLDQQRVSIHNERYRLQQQLATAKDVIDGTLSSLRTSVGTHSDSEQGYVKTYGSNHHLAVHHRTMRIAYNDAINQVNYKKALKGYVI